MVELFIGNLLQHMVDAVQSSLLLADTLDNPPACLWDMGALKHFLFCFGIFLPESPRLEIHGAELPLLEWIVNSHQEAQVLLLIGDREPILDEGDAGPYQHSLELRYRAEKLLGFRLGTEPHHALDACSVVP